MMTKTTIFFYQKTHKIQWRYERREDFKQLGKIFLSLPDTEHENCFDELNTLSIFFLSYAEILFAQVIWIDIRHIFRALLTLNL